MKFVDLLLYSEEDISDFETLYKKHQSTLGYLNYLPDDFEVTAIQHAGFSGEFKKEKVCFKIIKENNVRWRFPVLLFNQLRSLAPDVILVHSMIFSWQILLLGLMKHSRTKIIVQNHAEKPGGKLRRMIERCAARYISGFLFVHHKQAEAWEQQGIIKNTKEIYEVMEGSTRFTALPGERGDWGPRFLWVGRLDRNKDPITVLEGILPCLTNNRSAKFSMVFNGGNLRAEVNEFLKANNLQQQVSLFENVSYDGMENYYRMADYFLLASHYEGSGFALCEAMACGCVPIVSDIPSFRAMVTDGKEGYLFPPGDGRRLSEILCALDADTHRLMKKRAIEKFTSELSFEAIARKVAMIARKVA